MLLLITKLQNLKAIHNHMFLIIFEPSVVINHKTTKFESNSQLYCSSSYLAGCVVINHKTTKFGSNSQHPENWKELIKCCYQSQNYKIWKQFITIHLVKHNKHVVVINHKITKFESNSQQAYTKANQQGCCYQSLNYKIWKQFTTSCLL